MGIMTIQKQYNRQLNFFFFQPMMKCVGNEFIEVGTDHPTIFTPSYSEYIWYAINDNYKIRLYLYTTIGGVRNPSTLLPIKAVIFSFSLFLDSLQVCRSDHCMRIYRTLSMKPNKKADSSQLNIRFPSFIFLQFVVFNIFPDFYKPLINFCFSDLFLYFLS